MILLEKTREKFVGPCFHLRLSQWRGGVRPSSSAELNWALAAADKVESVLVIAVQFLRAIVFTVDGNRNRDSVTV